ncbi:Symplekin C-terminal domain-containing protein [Entamoeba marina]
MQVAPLDSSFFETAIKNLQTSSVNKLDILNHLHVSFLRMNDFPPQLTFYAIKLLDLLNFSLQSVLPTTRHVLLTYSIIFKLISLIVQIPTNSKNQDFFQKVGSYIGTIVNYTMNCRNISLFSHGLNLISHLIRKQHNLFPFIYQSFKDFCILPYSEKFTPIQLQSISILVEFHVSKISIIAYEYNAIGKIPMLYPITSFSNIRCKTTIGSSRIPDKILDRYHGIERTDPSFIANIIVNIISTKPFPHLPYRYGMPTSLVGVFYKTWKDYKKKLRIELGFVSAPKERQNIRDDMPDSLKMEEVEMEEEMEMEEEKDLIVKQEEVKLEPDTTPVNTIDFAVQSVVHVCDNYEKSIHPIEQQLCSKIISDIVLTMANNPSINITTIPCGDISLLQYLIEFSLKDSCRNINVLLHLLFELYLRKHTKLYSMLFEAASLKLLHPPQHGLVQFLTNSPFVPRELPSFEEVLTSLLIIEPINDKETSMVIEEPDKKELKDEEDNPINETKNEEVNPMQECEHESMSFELSDDPNMIEEVKTLVNVLIEVMCLEPSSHIVFLPLLIRTLYCFPGNLQQKTVTSLCAEVFPRCGGLIKNIENVVLIASNTDVERMAFSSTQLLYSMCLYDLSAMPIIINTLQTLQPTQVFTDAFSSNLNHVFFPLYNRIKKEPILVEYVKLITTATDYPPTFILPLLQQVCDFYLPAIPDHEFSVIATNVSLIILKKFVDDPQNYYPFLIVVLPIIEKKYLAVLLPWVLQRSQTTTKHVLFRLLTSRCTRHKFEDILVIIIDSHLENRGELITILCDIMKGYQGQSLYKSVNFIQAINILISKPETNTLCVALIQIINCGVEEKFYSDVVNQVLKRLSGSSIGNEDIVIFASLVETLLPQGINLLMLLSEQKFDLLSNQCPNLITILQELPEQQLAEVDKSIIKNIERQKKPL